MLGLMTRKAHEGALAAQEANANRLLDEVVKAHRERIAAADREAEGWRFLAQKLAGDLIELQKRAHPAIPGSEESEVGVIADDDWTPSAIARRDKKVS